MPVLETPEATSAEMERARRIFARQRRNSWRLFGAGALLILMDAWAVSAEFLPRPAALAIAGVVTLGFAWFVETVPACPHCGFAFGRTPIRHSCPNCRIRLIP